jgi:hypothetical protein
MVYCPNVYCPYKESGFIPISLEKGHLAQCPGCHKHFCVTCHAEPLKCGCTSVNLDAVNKVEATTNMQSKGNISISRFGFNDTRRSLLWECSTTTYTNPACYVLERT